VGVIGLGFMGRTHLAAYRHADAHSQPCRVVAVADRNTERLAGRASPAGNIATEAEDQPAFDPKQTHACEEPQELLADPGVELVSICTPTDSHVDLTIAAIESGKHVLVEKPLAVRSCDAKRVADAARASDRIVMPAMCMRFWPAWAHAKRVIDSGEFGPVRSATFHRLGSMPAWGKSFYSDDARSGGALVDLHIHDADFVLHCFGRPDAVTSTGSPNHLTTLYSFYDGPAHIVAEGGWGHASGFGFKMRYVIAFNRVTLDFDLARDPQLLLCDESAARPIELPPTTGYDEQALAILAAVRSSKPAPVACDDAVAGLELLEAERESLRTGSTLRLERDS
ncbi:MAG: Gfo/Idh/MocA family oxidoreductase, partial [Planctomycetota bacterium]